MLGKAAAGDVPTPGGALPRSLAREGLMGILSAGPNFGRGLFELGDHQLGLRQAARMGSDPDVVASWGSVREA